MLPPLFARPPTDATEDRRVRRLAGARHAPASWLQRARIVTLSWDGAQVGQIAAQLGCHPRTVYRWLHRFNQGGIEGLGDLPRAGRPRRLGELERGRIIALARSDPPGRLRRLPGGSLTLDHVADEAEAAVAHWTLDALAEAAQAQGIMIGRSQVRRVRAGPRDRGAGPRPTRRGLGPSPGPQQAAVVAARGLPRVAGGVRTARGGILRPEARALLAAAPTPADAARLTPAELVGLLRQAGRRRRLATHAARLHAVFAAPACASRRWSSRRWPTRPGTAGRAEHRLRQRRGAGCRHRAGVRPPPRRKIITSFAGLGPLTGARGLAELGDDRSRFAAAKAVKAYAGAAPVTRASGKSLHLSHRRVKNQRLATAGYQWAFAALTASPGAHAHYQRRRRPPRRPAQPIQPAARLPPPLPANPPALPRTRRLHPPGRHQQPATA